MRQQRHPRDAELVIANDAVTLAAMEQVGRIAYNDADDREWWRQLVLRQARKRGAKVWTRARGDKGFLEVMGNEMHEGQVPHEAGRADRAGELGEGGGPPAPGG